MTIAAFLLMAAVAIDLVSSFAPFGLPPDGAVF